MNAMLKFWNNFKTQPDIWFFYAFLLTFTLSIRKVLFFYPIGGRFNEYTGVYLYLNDIFLFLALSIWAVNILRKNYDKLSTPLETRARHEIQPHKLFIPFKNRGFLTGSIAITKLWLKKAIIILPLILVIWSFVSILWSENQNIALFRAIKLLEFYFLYLYIIFRIVHPASVLPLPRGGSEGGVVRNTFLIMIALGFIQAIIGIWQFIIQHSVGLFWLKESLISPDMPGVAKIVLDGEKYIRSYGLFPHPNILGGFLLISITLTWIYGKLFHMEHSQPCHSERSVAESKNLIQTIKLKLDPSISFGMTILTILLIIQIAALILTFSKSAIIGLLMGLFYILFKLKKSVVYNHVKIALISALVILLILIMAKPSLKSFFIQGTEERLFYLNVSRETIISNPIIGLGVGQFVINMQNYAKQTLEYWQFQPVHNIFLLVLSELGFVGLFMFIWFLWKLFHVKQMGKSHPERSITKSKDLTELDSSALLEMTVFKGILLGLIIIMLFDHYLWDIQQGQVMLWLVLGLVAGVKNNEK